MAQLKDKDGAFYNPNTIAENVEYASGTSVKQKIQQIEQSGGGGSSTNVVEFTNLFNIDDIVANKGVVYGEAGAIQSNSSYSCVFIPLELDKVYSISGLGGSANAFNFALAKGTKSSFSNLLASDFVENAHWLKNDAIFTHGTNYIYKQNMSAALSNYAFNTPKASDLVDGNIQLGIVINTRYYSTNVNNTMRVCQAPYTIDHVGSIRGKNAAFFGDSITAGQGGNFVNVVKSKLGLNLCFNYGAHGDQTPDLKTQMLAVDPSQSPYPKPYTILQAVVIQIGTNGGVSGDIDKDIPTIGVYDIESYPYSYSASGKTIETATLNEPRDFFSLCFANTFYGNVAASIEYVRYINPDCKIYLVTIPPSERANYPIVREALIALGAKMGVEVIDAQANAGIGVWNITYWSSDQKGTGGQRVHLNAKGAEMWGSYIAHEIERKWFETELNS